MTALSAIQAASIRLIGRKPSVVFSATATFEVEMADLVNEVAADIAASHDWQALTKTHTLTGDGTTTAFDLPSDYARMLIKADLIDTRSFAWGYTRIVDINEFLYLVQMGVNALPGNWILYGNQFQFQPAPASGATTIFPYVDKRYALGADAVAKDAFTADDDTFRLPERLLTLGLIWKWRENKKLDFGADEANFVKAFNEAAGRDKGSRIIATGPKRFAGMDVTLAYPNALGS